MDILSTSEHQTSLHAPCSWKIKINVQRYILIPRFHPHRLNGKHLRICMIQIRVPIGNHSRVPIESDVCSVCEHCDCIWLIVCVDDVRQTLFRFPVSCVVMCAQHLTFLYVAQAIRTYFRRFVCSFNLAMENIKVEFSTLVSIEMTDRIHLHFK